MLRLLCMSFVVVVAACEGPLEVEGEGEEGEGEGGNQSVDVGCDGDDACDDGLVCDLATGDCAPGFDCSVNTTICGFCGTPDVDCGFGSAASFCDVDHGGVCRRTKGACAPCAVDAECGVAESGLDSRCLDGFCAPGCGACPEGFGCTEGGCVPVAAAGTCEGAILCGGDVVCPDGLTCSELGVCLALCGSDVDCALGDICVDAGPLAGTCVQGCPIGQLVNQDGVEKICHGDGRFGDPCVTPGQQGSCASGTECRSDGACELAGCQSDAECPLPRTYCDVVTATCLNGCNGVDDCAAFELCTDNQCEAQGCRGKDSSCNIGEFCCGEELFADATTCPVDDGLCFFAPDPFCRTCAEDADCADITSFDQASFCYELTRQNPQTGADESLGKFCSTGCRDNDDCPRGVRCQLELPTSEEGVTTQGCLDVACAGFGQ
ncbi:MAG: hypothetical protein Q8O67_25500 [Deltaproteobacteria bacterium]|nr:hypothetical protein [Deltaproteobacteria bacterium]